MPTDLRSIALPYCLKRQADGLWFILNLQYKPLGFVTTAWVDYDAYPIALPLRLTPKTVAKLSYDGQGIRKCLAFDGTGGYCEMIFLYSDKCVPTASAAHLRAYLVRLGVLAKVKVAGTC